MAQAKQGDSVKVHYTGKFADGTVFDSSTDRDSLQFTIGAGEIIPGFEQAVIGMIPGESKTTTIPADEAYGPHMSNLVFTVERNVIPANVDPAVGQRFQVRQKDGSATVVTVVAVSDSNVTMDANHPLAGKDLTFDIQLVEIV